MNRSATAIISAAHLSEVQAIAIYEAEVFFIRKPERRALLKSILQEEKDHDAGLSEWAQHSAVSLKMNRALGLTLGTALSLLPWKILCHVQAWAEDQAADIYANALRELSAQTEAVDPSITEALTHAEMQEREHAQRFRSLTRETKPE
ncbi:MAG: demethoxyubiquinone hydroxylase family protein [Cryobacterium sp.]|nr:demethoxyubiquinone hydroxylase family protein [Oligoflexia bacterium]